MNIRLKTNQLNFHPGQPLSRTRNTTDLQASMRLHGLLVPILVATDMKTVLSGARRLTAAKALGWKEIDAQVLDVNCDDPAALDVLAAANEQEEMETLDLLHVLQSYERHGIKLDAAAERVGIGIAKRRTLMKLASAPEQVREAIQVFERSSGRDGMSVFAFREMENMSSSVMLEILNGDSKTVAAVKRERKKQAEVNRSDRMLEDQEALEAALDIAARLVKDVYYIRSMMGRSLEFFEILQPAKEDLRRLWEAL